MLHPCFASATHPADTLKCKGAECNDNWGASASLETVWTNCPDGKDHHFHLAWTKGFKKGDGAYFCPDCSQSFNEPLTRELVSHPWHGEMVEVGEPYDSPRCPLCDEEGPFNRNTFDVEEL